MPIILKNAIINPEEIVKKQTPLVDNEQKYKWDNDSKQLISTEQPNKIVKKIKNIEETQVEEKYQHIEHGDLHKLINTKSDYLSDMLGLKK